jgi:uncharacterized protein (DUF1786 family)
VKALGVEIKEFFHPGEEQFDLSKGSEERCFLELVEVEIPFYMQFFEKLGIDLLTVDAIAVAVQDHGDPPNGMSNRENRYRLFREFMSRDASPTSMAFMDEELPKEYTRMRSALERVRKYFPRTPVMLADTAMAAIFGILAWREEEGMPTLSNEPYVAINLGNNHTLGVIMNSGKITAFLEHHTWAYKDDPGKLRSHLEALADGSLDAPKMVKDGGEGAFSLSKVDFSKIKSLAVTGPNRAIVKKSGLDYEMAELGGDQMMTGPLGLVWALYAKKGLPFKLNTSV